MSKAGLTTASRLALCAFALTALPSLANGGIADVSCDDRARLVKMLEQSLGAERKGMGLRDPETMLEVWVNQQSGDWLIVQNYANGTSCVVAMGDHWEGLAFEKPA